MASPGKKCGCRACRFSMRCPHGSFATRYATRAHRHTTKNDLNKGCEPAKTYSLPRMG